MREAARLLAEAAKVMEASDEEILANRIRDAIEDHLEKNAMDHFPELQIHMPEAGTVQITGTEPVDLFHLPGVGTDGSVDFARTLDTLNKVLDAEPVTVTMSPMPEEPDVMVDVMVKGVSEIGESESGIWGIFSSLIVVPVASPPGE